ncbi:MAG: NifB/NifX family molybdenum-iron cluster-binding protein [Arcobacteraceae bacterium]|jgi:predicted Fe-Mo cluster-binding NifX family protein|nr:NifB/NifX family molybdenum-iron cluster-binding protein [Arcobacteraceae bacterium]
MIAIPIKTNKENSAVSPLFGKAKYFAISDKGAIKIVKNTYQGGRAVVQWLQSLGVQKVIVSHIGHNPFGMLQISNIKVYFAGEERIEFKEILLKYSDGDLILLNEFNFDIFMKDDDHDGKPDSHSHQKGPGNGFGAGTGLGNGGKNKKHIKNSIHNKFQNKFAKSFQIKD